MRRPILLSVLLLALLTPSLAAQDITGHAEGQVLGPDGAPFAGAEVLIEGTGLPRGRITRTDRRGRFRLEQIPIGEYRMRIRSIGHRPVVIRGLSIRLGRTSTAPTVLLEAIVVELPSLEVTADRPLIDPSSAAGGGNLRTDRLDGLPVERSYQSLPALLPGINLEVAGLNVNGGTGLENQFYVDGANVTEFGAGASSTMLPPDFIQEVEVRTGGYEAEYRGTLGGNINVVTKSGGDAFRGQVFGYTLSNQLTATPRSVPGNTSSGDFARTDAGGSLGGPLVRGRLWFFAAYNRSHDVEDRSIPGFGIRQDALDRESFATKFTWQPSDRSTVVGSWFGDPTEHADVGNANQGVLNPDPLLRSQRVGGTTFSVQATEAFSDRLFLRLTGALIRQRDESRGATAIGAAEPFFIDSTGAIGGGVGEHWEIQMTRVSLGGSVAYIAGAHQVKGGIEYTSHKLAFDWHTTVIQQFGAAAYGMGQYDLFGTISNRVPSLYLQDSWALSGRFRLNAGLRWDGQYLYGSDGKRSLTIADQWQPRLGFVALLDQRGEARFFGSYGRYYQDIQGALAGLYFTYGTLYSERGCATDPRVDSTACAPPSVPLQRTPAQDLNGQSYDEIALGFERALSPTLKVRARALRRWLGWGIEDARVEIAPGDSAKTVGNPGRGALGDYPRMRRDYTALELAVEGRPTTRLWMMASYVWSRTYGNHSGLYDSDEESAFPNINPAYDVPDLLVNSTGRLGNDRPHVLKVNSTYQFPRGVSLGTSIALQSGVPLNELGRIPDPSGDFHAFLVPRGTAGRTPPTWDLNVRGAWSLSESFHTKWRPTLLLDLYHVGSPRRTLAFDQVHFRSVDSTGNQIDPNPDYHEPLSFQPPMAARLGITVAF